MKKALIVILLSGCNSLNWATEEKGTVIKIEGNTVCVEYKLHEREGKAMNCFYHESGHEYKVSDIYPK